MAPEKKNSDINIANIPHTGKLNGEYQELPPIEDAPSVQEFQGLDTSELQQVAPAPETSGMLTLDDSERGAFKDKHAAQREYHEQQSANTSESHTGRNIGAGLAVLALAGGAFATVSALNNHSSEASPSPSATDSEGLVGNLPTASATAKATAENSLAPTTEASSATNTGLEGYTKSLTITLPERANAGVTDAEVEKTAEKLEVKPVYTSNPNLLTTKEGVLEAYDLMQPQLQKLVNAAHVNRNQGPEENAVVRAYRSKLEGPTFDKGTAPLALEQLAKVGVDPVIADDSYIYMPKSKGHGDFMFADIDKLDIATGNDGQKVATGTLGVNFLIVDTLPAPDKVIDIDDAEKAQYTTIPVQFRLMPAANGQFEIKIV